MLFYKALENNILNEILDQKECIITRLKAAMDKMSKKLLSKLMDYINLKFKIALVKNKIDVDQEVFVTQEDMVNLYNKISKTSSRKKLIETKKKVSISNNIIQNSAKTSPLKPTYSNISSELIDFTSDIVDHMNAKIECEIDSKFSGIEQLIHNSLNTNIKEMGK